VSNLLQVYKNLNQHAPHHSAAAMATSRQPVKKKRALEQLLTDASSDICPYCPAGPAFFPQRVLLRRLFLINSDRTKYVSVGFYPGLDYQPLVDFGAIRRDSGSNSSFSKTSISTRWRTVYPRCSFQSAMVVPVQGQCARGVPSAYQRRKSTDRQD